MNMKFEDVRWETTTKGTIGFIMCFDEIEEKLYFYAGIAEGLNERIDVNHIFAGGFELPAEAGIALFFGNWEESTR